MEKARVVPLLLDIKPTEIKGPLSQFQAIQATENDIKKLVTGINLTVFASGEKGVERSFIEEAFKLWWPKLKLSIENIPKAPEVVKQNVRSEKEMIEELLILVRRLMVKPFRPTVPTLTQSDNVYFPDMPPPPDNFPAGWNSEWQPSLEDAVEAAKPSLHPKTNKDKPNSK